MDISGCDRYIDYTGFTGVYNTPVEEGQCRMPTIHRCEGSECEYKRLKRKEQECEEVKTQLKQVKYLYEVQDEKLIDELATENQKYKQALDEIEKYLDIQQKYFDGEDYHNIFDIINKTKEV